MDRYTVAQVHELAIQDKQRLECARGYYGLKLYADAEAELSNASPFSRSRTDFLELRSLIYAAKGEWLESLLCADEIIAKEPDNAMGYILRADAVRQLEDGGLRAAYKILADVVDKFHDCLTPKYNLACFACASGNLRTARKWLIKTFRDAIGTEYQGFYQNLAFYDPDLKLLWRELSRINEVALRLNQRAALQDDTATVKHWA